MINVIFKRIYLLFVRVYPYYGEAIHVLLYVNIKFSDVYVNVMRINKRGAVATLLRRKNQLYCFGFVFCCNIHVVVVIGIIIFFLNNRNSYLEHKYIVVAPI